MAAGAVVQLPEAVLASAARNALLRDYGTRAADSAEPGRRRTSSPRSSCTQWWRNGMHWKHCAALHHRRHRLLRLGGGAGLSGAGEPSMLAQRLSQPSVFTTQFSLFGHEPDMVTRQSQPSRLQ